MRNDATPPDGGHPAIGFANAEYATLADLVDWLVAHGFAADGDRAALTGGRREAEAAFAAAMTFRDEVRRMLDLAASGEAIDARAIASVNGVLATCGCHARLEPTPLGIRRTVAYRYGEPGDVLMPLGNIAADALCGLDPGRIRCCRSARCGRFFYDATKNRTRTWCSMQRCGNRHKAAAYYRRIRVKSAGGGS